MEENDTIPDMPVIQPVTPENITAPVVHVAAPAIDHTERITHIEEHYNDLSSKLGEISGKLDALAVARVPEPVAAPTLESTVNAHNAAAQEVKETIPDAVTLTVDDHKPKPPAKQEEVRRRALRRNR